MTDDSDPSPAPTRTRLTVVNGNLTFARYPVLDGHFIGDAVAGSEADLDAALDGALLRRYQLGVYPGPVRSAIVARHPRGLPVMGAVVGLGDAASFSVGAIRTAVTTGLLEIALADPPAPPGEAPGVTLLMLGARKTAVSPSDTLGAMLGAVAEAQRRIVQQSLTPFGEVQVIAQMEDEAHVIWHALKRLVALPSHTDDFDLYPQIVFAAGATRRIAPAEDPDGWQVIQIAGATLSDGSHGFRFAAVGGQARVEGTLVGANNELVRQLIEGAEYHGAAGAEGASPARALFELVWPPELKRVSHEDRNLRLIVDQQAAALPFELMDDRRLPIDGEAPETLKPPGVRHGLLRQLVQDDFARLQLTTHAQMTALVVGDPRMGDPPPGFPPLPGAVAEAHTVADLLEAGGYQVTRLIGDKIEPTRVIETVLRGGWTVIHIAGHGVYDYRFPSQVDAAAAKGLAADTVPRFTGVVLADHFTLSPSILQSMPDPPALAFINCCDLGTISPSDEDRRRAAGRPEFAAGFAAELIALGCRAVIASGWEVNDAGAMTFATTLYGQLLDGQLGFGEAVRVARAAVYDQASVDGRDPANTTWGAYQCYGEPDWRLSADKPLAVRQAPPPTFASHHEALAAIESIRNEAAIGVGRAGRREALVSELDAAEAAARTMQWMNRPRVAELLGEAHAALGALPRAIDCFEEALKYDSGRARQNSNPTLQLVQTLADYRIRTAAAPGPDGARPTDADALAAIGRIRDQLVSLCQIVGENSERLSLIGVAAKHEAELAKDAELDAALGRMRDAYRRAWDFDAAADVEDAYYPAINAVTAAVLIALRQGSPCPPDDLAAVARAGQAIGESVARDDVWRLQSRIAHQIVDRLAAGDLTDTAAADIVGAIQSLWESAGTDVEMDSMTAHIRFIANVLDGAKPAAASLTWVQSLEAAVSQAMGAPAGTA